MTFTPVDMMIAEIARKRNESIEYLQQLRGAYVAARSAYMEELKKYNDAAKGFEQFDDESELERS